MASDINICSWGRDAFELKQTSNDRSSFKALFVLAMVRPKYGRHT